MIKLTKLFAWLLAFWIGVIPAMAGSIVPPIKDVSGLTVNSGTVSRTTTSHFQDAVSSFDYGCLAVVNNPAADAAPCIQATLNAAASLQKKAKFPGAIYYIMSPISFPAHGVYALGDAWNLQYSHTGTWFYVVSSNFMSGGSYNAAAVASLSGTTMAVASVSAGTLQNGAVVQGSGVAPGTYITGQTSGAVGGSGNYTVSNSQTVGSESITAIVPPISIFSSNSNLVDSIAFTEDQPADTSGWSPNVYGPMIYVAGTKVPIFRNLLGYGINQFIDLATTNGVIIDGLTGQFHTYGVYAESDTDYSHFRHFHINDFACSITLCPNVTLYDENNASTILSLRNDTPNFEDIDSYGVFAQFNFGSQASGSTTGPTTKAKITNSDCDKCYQNLLVTGSNTTVQVDNMSGQGTSLNGLAQLTASRLVYVTGNNVAIDLRNIRGTSMGDSIIYLAGSTDDLRLSGFRAENWGSLPAGARTNVAALDPGSGNTVSADQMTFFPATDTVAYPANVGIANGDLIGWSPVLEFGSATTGIVQTNSAAVYQQDYHHIYLEFAITLTSKGSATGAASVHGVPIAANGSGSWGHAGAGSCATATNLTSLTSPVFPFMSAGGTTIALSELASAGAGYTNVTDANFTNTSTIRCNFEYFQ